MSLLRRDAMPAAGGGMDGGDRPRCQRRLFADEDGCDGQPGATDNLANVFQEELRRARDAAKERWNFDFENERPLEGNWVWEAVEPAPGGGAPPAAAAGPPPQPAEQEEVPPAAQD